MSLTFIQLNHGWNAEPNAPEAQLSVSGTDVTLRFGLNHWVFEQFAEDSVATLRFTGCRRVRLGATNDEGWFHGQCRFSQLAPAWGEFYRIEGDSELLLAPDDWILIDGPETPEIPVAHYLFYLRDDTFECVAAGWSIELPTTQRA